MAFVFRFVSLLACVISFTSAHASSSPIFRSRPAFSAQADELVQGYLRADKSEFVESSFKTCPLANAYVQSVFGRLLAIREATKFKTSIYAPKILVECSGAFGKTGTRAMGLIEVSAGDLRAAESDDEFAFLLAHELSHVTLGHFELIAAWREKLKLTKRREYTPRRLELEADENAVRWLRAANFNAANGVLFLKRTLLFAKDHPADFDQPALIDRVKKLTISLKRFGDHRRPPALSPELAVLHNASASNPLP